MTAGMKFDNDKPRLDLLLDFGKALEEIGKVATFGANKYAPGNWLLVQDAQSRYQAALLRHLFQSNTAEKDPETDLDHLAHVAWNALAVLELKLRQIDRQKPVESK